MSADEQSRWQRVLAPLRSEAAMFQLLLRVAAAAAIVVAIVLLVRAVG